MLNRTMRGFTLLELMISIGMLAVLIAIGVPALTDLVQKRQIQGAVDEVKFALAAARSEAVKRNEPVTVAFTRTSATNWCVGFRNGLAACDCTQNATNAADYCGLYDAGGNLQTTHRSSFDADSRVELDAAPAFGGDAIFAFDPGTGVLANNAGVIDFGQGGDCVPYPAANNENGVIALSSADDEYAVRICVFPTGTTNVCRTTDAPGGIEPCA